jgi:hypothetical protein
MPIQTMAEYQEKDGKYYVIVDDVKKAKGEKQHQCPSMGEQTNARGPSARWNITQS